MWVINPNKLCSATNSNTLHSLKSFKKSHLGKQTTQLITLIFSIEYRKMIAVLIQYVAKMLVPLLWESLVFNSNKGKISYEWREWKRGYCCRTKPLFANLTCILSRVLCICDRYLLSGISPSFKLENMSSNGIVSFSNSTKNYRIYCTDNWELKFCDLTSKLVTLTRMHLF